jgi:ParB/RepB/Spo0J family partition protein
MKEEKIENVHLADIAPDSGQPRKYFDDRAMSEMIRSVYVSGVMQPIIIRPNTAKQGAVNWRRYIIVVGERRYRAACAVAASDVSRSTIPAIIRIMTAEEALDAQIVENLQREDVNPMEEARAFRIMLDKRKMTLQDIAANIGKIDMYVRQRLKLLQLTAPWQKILYNGKISITLAMRLASLPAAGQAEIYSNHQVTDEQLSDPDYRINIGDWYFKKVSGSLLDACFSLEDTKLSKKMGACVACQYNSAVSKLFPEAEANPTCSNKQCFQQKTDLQYQLDLKVAFNTPGTLLISSGHTGGDKSIRKLKADGHKVLQEYTDFTRVRIQSVPLFSVFERQWLKSHNNDDSGAEEAFNADLSKYFKAIEAAEKKIKTGTLHRGFVVAGDNKGKFEYISLVKHKQVASASARIKEGTPTIEDVDTEINRLKERELRAQELDQAKIWAEIRPLFNPEKETGPFTGSELLQDEMAAIALAMYYKIGFSRQDHFKKTFFPLEDITPEAFRNAERYFFMDTLPPANLEAGHIPASRACMRLAAIYKPEVLQQAIATQKDIADKRKVRVCKRVDELQEQKSLLKPAKSAAKKPVSKKQKK